MLSDVDKRKLYDRGGEEAVNKVSSARIDLVGFRETLLCRPLAVVAVMIHSLPSSATFSVSVAVATMARDQHCVVLMSY